MPKPVRSSFELEEWLLWPTSTLTSCAAERLIFSPARSEPSTFTSFFLAVMLILPSALREEPWCSKLSSFSVFPSLPYIDTKPFPDPTPKPVSCSSEWLLWWSVMPSIVTLSPLSLISWPESRWEAEILASPCASNTMLPVAPRIEETVVVCDWDVSDDFSCKKPLDDDCACWSKCSWAPLIVIFPPEWMVISACFCSPGAFSPDVSSALPATSIEATTSVLFPESMAMPSPPVMLDPTTWLTSILLCSDLLLLNTPPSLWYDIS